MGTYAEGDNYRIVFEGHLATSRVWRRPDLDSAAGARCAQEILDHVRALASGHQARGLIMDQREAPPVAGPKTEEALSQMLSAFERHAKPIALVMATPLQKLQHKRLVEEHASTHGAVFDDEIAAREWVQGRMGE